jgi:putative transposase
MTDRNETIETQAAIPQALLDHVMANDKKPADLIGENGMLKQLTKAVIEAAPTPSRLP